MRIGSPALNRFRRGGAAFRAFLAAAMVLPALAVSPIHAVVAHATPTLLQLAAQHPDQDVSVIVQKTTKDKEIETTVQGMGGKITQDLHIINSFAASMPAGAAAKLSTDSRVRWISEDAPVTHSGSQQNSQDTAQFTTWANEGLAPSSSSQTSSFNSRTINAGSTLWFNSMMKVNGVGNNTTATINFDNAAILVSIYGTTYTFPIPSASITYSPGVTQATTTYDDVNGKWVTMVPSSVAGTNVFLSGSQMYLNQYLAGAATTVIFTGRFTTDTPGVTVNTWKWSAATYSNFNSNLNQIGVKPVDDGHASQYQNSDKAGTPENYKPYVIPGARGGGAPNYTGDYSSGASVTPSRVFTNIDLMTDAVSGPNNTYGYGSSVVQAFDGFSAEKNPDQHITRVEAVLQTYVSAQLGSGETPRLTLAVNGQNVQTVNVPVVNFNTHIGVNNVGTVYVDLTGSRNWLWTDFDNHLQLNIDQSLVSTSHKIYYDAIGLRVTLADGADSSDNNTVTNDPNAMVDLSKLDNVYNQAIHATDVWSGASGRVLQGQGISIAVVDSGVLKVPDLGDHLVNAVNFDPHSHTSMDAYGHGTFVAGILSNDGSQSNGKYMGVAPKSGLVNVRVTDDNGISTEADVVAALQWVNDNKQHNNVRVVNLSLNSTVPMSYDQSPLDAACEVLWFNGLVVVVAAGNNGTNVLYPPANDPFVITVGATDDRGTASLADDTIPTYSAYGTTEIGTSKPDIVAPGTHIIGLLPQNSGLQIAQDHPQNIVNSNYFKMSGTSMATPMVSAAVALLLQDEPNLNPDQVKYRLMSTAVKSSGWPGYDPTKAGAGYLNVLGAITSTSMNTANTGQRATHLLWTGENPVQWGSVNWSSVNWSSVNWSSVNWSSVNWSSVNWSSDYWYP